MDCPNCGVGLKNCIEIDPDAGLPPNRYPLSADKYDDERMNLNIAYEWAQKDMADWMKKK